MRQLPQYNSPFSLASVVNTTLPMVQDAFVQPKMEDVYDIFNRSQKQKEEDRRAKYVNELYDITSKGGSLEELYPELEQVALRHGQVDSAANLDQNSRVNKSGSLREKATLATDNESRDRLLEEAAMLAGKDPEKPKTVIVDNTMVTIDDYGNLVKSQTIPGVESSRLRGEGDFKGTMLRYVNPTTGEDTIVSSRDGARQAQLFAAGFRNTDDLTDYEKFSIMKLADEVAKSNAANREKQAEAPPAANKNGADKGDVIDQALQFLGVNKRQKEKKKVFAVTDR